jgi:hypothetical protein
MPFDIALVCSRRNGTKNRLCCTDDPNVDIITHTAPDNPNLFKATIGEVIIQAQREKWRRINYQWVCPHCY